MKHFYALKIAMITSVMMIFGLNICAQNRTVSGHYNNLTHLDWGATGTDQLMVTPTGFGDGISTPAGDNRLNPREISNIIFHQDELLPDALELSDYAWVWGQFIDHDITLSLEDPRVASNISVPSGDPYFDPNGTGNVVIHSFRSAYNPNSGTGINNKRRFPNSITAFVDASNVYGSDKERSDWLRTFTGGKLKKSVGNRLPYNTLTGEYSSLIDPNAPEMAMANPRISKWFIAGDVRANENILLTSIHTIFLREHNRLCDIIRKDDPALNDEEIYQRARKVVGALIQSIVYTEWLPTLGVHLNPYEGYNASVNPGIMNIFSSAAYRYGHTVINSDIIRLDADGNTIPQGNTNLRNAFFNPQVFVEGGIDPLVRGMATQVEQDFDAKMIDDLRNFLFGPPGAGGLDLAALNINRGRERGLTDYNSVRKHFGLTEKLDFSEITSNNELSLKLEEVFGNVNDIDPWVGFLSEDHMSNTLFGETVMNIMEVQFTNLRDGDRFFYLNDPLLSDLLDEIRNTKFSDIIIRNTNATNLQDNVFLAEPMVVAVNDHMKNNLNMTIYPNPSTENFHVQTESQTSGSGLVSVYNLNGQLLFSEHNQFTQGMNQYTLTLTDLPSGVYNMAVQIGAKTGQKKLIKK